MWRYVAKRLQGGLVSVIGVSVLIFAMMRVIPGDPALVILAERFEGVPPPQELAELRRALGTDRALTTQYLDWIGGLIRWDLGKSWLNNVSIADQIARRMPVTLQLALVAIVITTGIGLSTGILAAVFMGSWIDYVVRVFAVIGLAVPIFLSATLVVISLGLIANWAPMPGYPNLLIDPLGALRQLIWPALAMGYYHAGVVTRMTRSQMLEVLNEDYVRTARAKGLAERIVVLRHALGNTLLPIVAVIGVHFTVMLGGSVIAETVFSLPGLGSALLRAAQFRDYLMVQNIILLFAIAIVMVNLIVDLAYAFLDPRVRLQ